MGNSSLVDLENSKSMNWENSSTMNLAGKLMPSRKQIELHSSIMTGDNQLEACNTLEHAQRQQDRTKILDDAIGVVTLVGAMKKQIRALSAFLGLENMLAIICRTTRAAQRFGIEKRGSWINGPEPGSLRFGALSQTVDLGSHSSDHFRRWVEVSAGSLIRLMGANHGKFKSRGSGKTDTLRG